MPALNSIHDSFEIAAVYTQPDKPVGRGMEMRPTPIKARALELGLPVFQPEKLTDPKDIEKLKSFQPDVIVVVAYGQILRQSVLDIPRLGCVNIHSSLLPRWRGAAPIQWAIYEGDLESGITTMYMEKKLDAGDILMQEKTAIREQDTGGTLHNRLAEMGGRLIIDTLKGLENGTLKATPQNEEHVTYAKKLEKEMQWLDPGRSAQELCRHVRAFDPWPGTRVWVENAGGLKVKAVSCVDTQASEGEIVEENGLPVLGTSDGGVVLEKVQWDGKKGVDSTGFLNGLKGRGISLPLKVTKYEAGS